MSQMLFFESTWIVQMYVAPRPQYFKAVVGSEKRLQQVLFIKETIRVKQLRFWILGWEKNIVDLNNGSLIKSPKYFQAHTLRRRRFSARDLCQ